MVENFGLKEIAIIGLSAVIAYMLLGNVGLAITALVVLLKLAKKEKA